MVAGSLVENTLKCPRIYLPKPKSSGFQWKKGFIGRPYSVIMFMHKKIAAVEFKDQLMSKGNSGVFNFSKKNKLENSPIGAEIFRSFFGRIETATISFWNYLTFKEQDGKLVVSPPHWLS